MSKFTRGKWFSCIAPSAIVIYGGESIPWTTVARIPNRGYPQHAKANVNLISKAPEMFELLKEFDTQVITDEQLCEWGVRVKSLIKEIDVD